MHSREKILQDSSESAEDAELKFQDFSSTAKDPLDQLPPFSDFDKDAEGLDDEPETANLLSEDKKQSSLWDFAYYQGFFDVDTTQVLRRIVWSMVPWPGRATYLHKHIKPNPDLYGPFWISATLVFSTAISGNMASYLQSVGHDKDIWKYDFHKVTFAATTIYCYAFLLPLALWTIIWYFGNSGRYSLLDILCVYGYSISIYVPISVLWVIRYNWFRWALVLIGAILSGSVLALTFWPAIREMKKKLAVTLLILILLLHALLAVGFVTYFFGQPEPHAVSSPATMLSTPTILLSTKATEVSTGKQIPNDAKTSIPSLTKGASTTEHSAKADITIEPRPTKTVKKSSPKQPLSKDV